MTKNSEISQVDARLFEISKATGDPEAAHCYEDELHIAVLRMVAAGSPDSKELARLALTTLSWDFPRWHA